MPLWDAFVKTSRNGTFLFERSYMDYHSDRFKDHSLMYYHKNRLIAVLPAVEERSEGSDRVDVLSSHSGPTFGGLILSSDARVEHVLEAFTQTKAYLVERGFRQWVYKSVPTIYHRAPSEDEDYALWKNNAIVEVCNISAVIDLRSDYEIKSSKLRVRCKRKAELFGFTIREIDKLEIFWPIVGASLRERYSTRPVHSFAEISLLKERFPNNIRCFVAETDTVAGGIIVYECGQVVHVQYPHATPEGKKNGVMDLLYSYLIDYYKEKRPDIRYFDFGTSNEQRGRYLNRTLIAFKEGFGARGVSYKTYRLAL